MMNSLKLYYWSKWNKCRSVRELLLQEKVKFEERDIYINPLNADEISEFFGDENASEIFSSRSPSLKKLGLISDSLNDKQKIKLMSEEPRLIKRPIIVFDGVIFAGINENSLREELNKKNLFS